MLLVYEYVHDYSRLCKIPQRAFVVTVYVPVSAHYYDVLSLLDRPVCQYLLRSRGATDGSHWEK